MTVERKVFLLTSNTLTGWAGKPFFEVTAYNMKGPLKRVRAYLKGETNLTVDENNVSLGASIV